MGIRDFFFKNSNNKKSKHRTFTEAPTKQGALSKYVVKAVSMIKGEAGGRDNLSASEYDLEEIRRASEADSYIKTAFQKYSYMLFKAGYVIKSENEKASEYINTRLYLMSFSTGKPVDILFQEIGDDLIKYSNAFLVKSRVKQLMPGVNAKGYLDKQPVGGYFRVDPTSMHIDIDKFGTIKGYVQKIGNEEKKFKPTDVVHLYLDKEAANAFGTPRVTAALEDVKALRRIEGNVIAMIYRFSMPLFQWIVGLPLQGFQATNKEIEDVQAEISNMSLDGTVVTNEKTQIKVIGAEGSAMDATQYLKYFEQRVFSALGVSESQMGRGGAKQDADSMESQAHDTVKHIQRVFAIFVENFIINELLSEGGFDPVTKVDDRTFMEFNEINLETKIKVENHEMSKYQSNMITFPEMRRAVGKKEDAETNELYKQKIEVEAERSIAQIRGDESIRLAEETSKLSTESALKIQAAAPKPAGGTGGNGLSPKGNGTTKDQKPNKDVSNKNTPANQHGKTSVKVKENSSTKNIELNESTKIVNRKKVKSKKAYTKIYSIYNDITLNLKEEYENKDFIISAGIDSMMNSFRQSFTDITFQGMNECIDDSNKLEGYRRPANLHLETSIVDDKVRKDLTKLFKNIITKIGDTEDPGKIESVFRAMEYRLRFIIEYAMPQVYWYSYVTTARNLGYKKAYIRFDGSKDEEKHAKVVHLSNFTLDMIPPFHPFCDCVIYLKKEEI